MRILRSWRHPRVESTVAAMEESATRNRRMWSHRRLACQGPHAARGRTSVSACVDVSAQRAGSSAETHRGIRPALRSPTPSLLASDALAIMVPHHLHERGRHRGLRCGCARRAGEADGARPRLPAAASSRSARAARPGLHAGRERPVLARGPARQAAHRRWRNRRVVTARSWHNFPPPTGVLPRRRQPWRFQSDAMGGGVALDTGSHWMRPLRMILGELDEVVATTGRIWPADGRRVARALAVPIPIRAWSPAST